MVGGSPTTPTFVLPYKRFATPCLLSRAREYLEKATVTYRKSVQHARCLIGYSLADPDTSGWDAHRGEQQVVDHSLLWRMAGWLGSLTWVLDKAREMILQSNPASTCHRLDGSVDPHKARSPERLATLETARQLLLIMPEWEECFGSKFFPKFATRSGFD